MGEGGVQTQILNFQNSFLLCVMFFKNGIVLFTNETNDIRMGSSPDGRIKSTQKCGVVSTCQSWHGHVLGVAPDDTSTILNLNTDYSDNTIWTYIIASYWCSGHNINSTVGIFDFGQFWL